VSTRQEILIRALELVLSNPQGVRFSELVNTLKRDFPETSPNAFPSYIWDLDKKFPDQIYKAARGLFRHTSFRDAAVEGSEGSEETRTGETPTTPAERPTPLREEDFYQSFADWLKNDLEEVTKVIVLGGHRFGGKWGTPDVIGIYKTKPSHIVKAEPIIVSAEIKMATTGTDLITAFGQACAYKIFSHKVYLVIPKSAPESDISRIESLSLILGIGLILFDNTDKENPKYEIMCRAMKHEPDIWYVNETMPEVEHELFA
jgi:hypothetical protein